MSYPYTSKSPLEELSNVKKRKRDEERPEALELDTRPFLIRPTSSEPFAKTKTFVPVCLLERAHLPLAYLDTAGTGSRLFTSDVKALESAHDSGVHGQLLVAEEKDEGRLYAVERTARKVYALCRLGAWVTRATVKQSAGASVARVENAPKRQALTSADGAQWWKRAVVDVSHREPPEKSHWPKLSLDLQAPASDQAATVEEADESSQPLLEAIVETQDVNTPSQPVSAQDALEELSRQYLDALYLSRTSLAYFAKGPLSRARAAFAGTVDSESHSSALAAFLRDAILTGLVMEKKYKEGITNQIKDLPLYSPEDQAKTAKSRRKKKWKAKRDKLGFFSNEAEFLAKWWREGDIDHNVSSPETMDLALRRRSSVLRIRETYLQIIVILEALAVESSSKNDTASAKIPEAASELQDTGLESTVESQPATDAKRSKPKKQQDLPAHLDTLLDRLGIWHSISSLSPTKQTTDTSSDEPSNELRNFCIEVIIPFYSSRLPEYATIVNKKLGGPSPPTSQPNRTAKSSARSKPGDPAPRQPRKPLSRVPTETNARSRIAKPLIPNLKRSATDPNVGRTIKREPSDLSSLASIPQAPAAGPRKRDRGALLRAASSTFREVDQDAQAAAAVAKLRGKAERDSQVREAIRMATKPNRQLANEEAAKRADEQHAKARAKPGRPTRPQPPQVAKHTSTVHVAATPRHPKATAPGPSFSHETVIPSSSARLKAPPLVHHAESTPAIPQTSTRMHEQYDRRHGGAGVQDTPSRPRTAMMPITGEAQCESPSASRRLATIAATPVRGFGGFGERAGVQVEATPVKRVGLGEGKGRGLFDENRGVVREKTVYGWDEEYEELA